MILSGKEMDLVLSLSIYFVLFLFNFTAVFNIPSCIVLKEKAHAQDSRQTETSPDICHIREISCPADAFPPKDENTKMRIEVCLSEKARSCTFTWPIEKIDTDHKPPPCMVLALREHDFWSGTEGLRCFNVSLPEHIDRPAEVIALTELQPHNGNDSWIESTLVLKNSSGISMILAGRTVFRNGEESICGEKNHCLLTQNMHVNATQSTCIGSLAQTNVNVSLPGIRIRLVELWAGENRTTCTGLVQNCILKVGKLYGGRFELKIRVTLSNSQICEFPMEIESQICEGAPAFLVTEPLPIQISTSPPPRPDYPKVLLVTEPLPIQTSTSRPARPDYPIVLLGFAVAICLAVLFVLGVHMCKHIRRYGFRRIDTFGPQNNNIQDYTVSYHRGAYTETPSNDEVQLEIRTNMADNQDVDEYMEPKLVMRQLPNRFEDDVT